MKRIGLVLVVMCLFFNVRVNGQGNWAWARQATGNGFQEGGMSMAADPLGNVYAIGIYDSTIIFGSIIVPIINQNYQFLTKYDPNGNPVWVKSTDGYAVATDKSGNVFVTGGFQSPTVIFESDTLINSGGYDMFVVKYDTNGNPIWARSSKGSSNEFGWSVTVDSSDNVYVTGRFISPYAVFGTDTIYNTDNTSTYMNMFLVKYDANGNELWAKTQGGAVGSYNDVFAYSITSDQTGNAFVTGFFDSPTGVFGSTTLINPMLYHTVMFLVKFDPSGNIVWAKGADGSSNSLGHAVAADYSGCIYVTGDFTNTVISPIGFDTVNLYPANTISGNMYLVKYDPNGNAIWARKSSGTGNGIGYSVATNNSGVYFTGSYTSNVIFGSDTLPVTAISVDPMFLVKFDFNGNLIFAKGLPSGGDDNSAVTTDGLGNAYISGDFYGVHPFIIGSDTLLQTASEENFFIAKYGPCITSNPSISLIGSDTLNSTTAVSYQWYLNGGVLVGDTMQTLIAHIGGNYTVVVTDQYDCQGISEPYVLVFTGIQVLANPSTITLFPNPTSTIFTITSTDKIESVKIYNVLGEVIWQNKYNNVTTATIDFTGNISSPSGRSGGAGIYFVEIKTDGSAGSPTIVRKKVVKE